MEDEASSWVQRLPLHLRKVSTLKLLEAHCYFCLVVWLKTSRMWAVPELGLKVESQVVVKSLICMNSP